MPHSYVPKAAVPLSKLDGGIAPHFRRPVIFACTAICTFRGIIGDGLGLVGGRRNPSVKGQANSPGRSRPECVLQPVGSGAGGDHVILHHPGEKREGGVLAAADRAQCEEGGVDDPRGNSADAGRLAENREGQRPDF
ncbi:hypothetical protein PSQ19_03735 [Devosia algicola]|uniref:Uncharacterized protein n=1 Tax=Devosia algicola TaxID=3026418 RepID=A0ABY7YQH4_9HYPH|nr:hypothetical protein [Devosia algicola]WDR03279.1 hypothetical protein PSQ19_03735 [Devosia algicola]